MRDIFRVSNIFWKHIYYDVLVNMPDFQISFLRDVGRLYFNCAHALQSSKEEFVENIESYFYQRNITPAIYIDPVSPKSLEKVLVKRGYHEIDDEKEIWYVLPKKDLDRERLAKVLHLKKKDVEFVLFYPFNDSFLLNEFLQVNAIANNIEKEVLAKLKKNMLSNKNNSIELLCGVALKDKKVVSTNLLGFYRDYIFIAEGATHPDFRKQGLYKQLIANCIEFVGDRDYTRMVVNCDKNSFSNNVFMSLGFSKMCERRFFQKQINL